MNLKERYELSCSEDSDIFQHLPVLYEYAKKCNHITEFGVRAIVSTWAFLYANPKNLISYDIKNPSEWGEDIKNVYNLAGTTKYKFREVSTLDVKINNTDLLFIDTLHTYVQVKNELRLHGNRVKKYIVFHDTETFGCKGEDGGEGINKAIDEFLSNGDWIIELKKTNNNGLTIIKRNDKR